MLSIRWRCSQSVTTHCSLLTPSLLNFLYFIWNRKCLGTARNVYSNCGLALGISPTSFASNSVITRGLVAWILVVMQILQHIRNQRLSLGKENGISQIVSGTMMNVSLCEKYIMTSWMGGSLGFWLVLHFISSIWYVNSTNVASSFRDISYFFTAMYTMFRHTSGLLQRFFIGKVDFGRKLYTTAKP